MSALRVREATIDDAGPLASRLRAADERELRAIEGAEPIDVLARGIAEADACWAIVDRGDEVIALFGIRADPKRDDAGRPWLLASDALAKHAKAFLRGQGAWIERLHERHPILWNYVDARNALHVRWLERCGFTRVKTIEHHGPEQRTFHQYARVREEQAP